MLNNAASQGVTTLHVQASFVNDSLLSRFATQAIGDYGATVTSVDGVQTFTFSLGGP